MMIMSNYPKSTFRHINSHKRKEEIQVWTFNCQISRKKITPITTKRPMAASKPPIRTFLPMNSKTKKESGRIGTSMVWK